MNWTGFGTSFKIGKPAIVDVVVDPDEIAPRIKVAAEERRS